MTFLYCESIDRIEVPFNRAFIHGGKEIKSKEIAILNIRDQDGNLFQGEIGPFRGVHQETLSQIDFSQLINRRFSISPVDQWDLTQPCFGQDLPMDQVSLQSAWEQVLFAHKLHSESLSPEGVVHLASLINLKDPKFQDRIKGFLDRGYGTFKIKLGRESFAEELKKLSRCVDLLKSDSKIRVDGNRHFSSEELGKIESLLGSNLDFVEDPWSFGSKMHKSHINLRIGIDEDLSQALKGEPSNKLIYVVKPMKFGLSAIFNLISRGVSNSQIVLSSCFDSGIATGCYLDLICFLNLSAAHGLGPYDYLVENKRLKELPLDQGILQWKGSSHEL